MSTKKNQKKNNLTAVRVIVTRESQNFCNILVCDSLQHVYHVTKAVQAVERYPLCLLVSW